MTGDPARAGPVPCNEWVKLELHGDDPVPVLRRCTRAQNQAIDGLIAATSTPSEPPPDFPYSAGLR